MNVGAFDPILKTHALYHEVFSYQLLSTEIMSKIKILPEQLANRIAAGEVIERPASVIKELLENSIDAGSNRIEVEIEGDGTRVIRVIDNGMGMDEDDVLLCFERHGTSKLNEENDLNAITSLGFRGEAIPSIASVSRMTITSRLKDSDLGTMVLSQYGQIKNVHEIGAPTGTCVEVMNLFGNTPARRKFLKTKRTELAHIDDTVKTYALSRPDISFTLRIDGRETIRLEKGMRLDKRLAVLSNYTGRFIPFANVVEQKKYLKISGLLVPPGSQAAIASRLRIFVNGRAIKDRMLSHAVNEGLRSFLLKGKQPTGLISIELPPEDIDVNVHPAKHEIRFRDNRTIHQKICDTIRSAMVAEQHHLRNELFTTRTEEPGQQANHETDTETSVIDFSPRIPTAIVPPESPDKDSSSSATTRAETKRPEKETSPAPVPLDFEQPLSHDVIRQQTVSEPQKEQVRVADLIVVGSFMDLYIFCRNGDKLIVIDQHAAHERLLFEELLHQYRNGTIASQNLLFPLSVELSVFQSQILEKYMDRIEEMGFSLRHFGGNTWVIAAIPAISKGGNGQDLLLDVLERFGSEKRNNDSGILENIIATMACKAAVKSGDQLSDTEIQGLLEKMAAADLFSHCPHGRPVVKIFNATDIKKWFHRT